MDRKAGHPHIRLRTKNEYEAAMILQLQAEGYTVYKRGWPDLLAVRGDEVRLIEVKRPGRSVGSPAQRAVASILRKCGLTVELAYGTLDSVEPMDPRSRRERRKAARRTVG